jgi:polysaccharide deacetylase family protein (PEP-CTERM system associated)
MTPSPLNAMTVDVEDYFHVEAFAKVISRERWDGFELRVEESTRRILDIFDRHAVKATFFTLGWVARKKPRLVAEIARRGHEIGCHSFWHRLVYNLSAAEFRSDLRDATRALEDAAQVKPRGYRAPSYSITKRSLWALEILAEEGYAYDSSIFPIRHDIYGYPGFPRFPVKVDLKSAGASIAEFPPSTVSVLGKNLPGPGGGYLRIFPLRYALWALRRIGGKDRMPASVYLHPWEVDPDQPRMAGPLRSRLRHYTGLRNTAARLDTILAEFRFAPMAQVLAEHPPERAWALDEAVA